MLGLGGTQYPLLQTAYNIRRIYIFFAFPLFSFSFFFFWKKKTELDVKEGRKIRFNLRKGHIIYFFVIHNFHFHPLFIFNFVRFINLKNENYCHGYRVLDLWSMVTYMIFFLYSILIQNLGSLKRSYQKLGCIFAFDSRICITTNIPDPSVIASQLNMGDGNPLNQVLIKH